MVFAFGLAFFPRDVTVVVVETCMPPAEESSSIGGIIANAYYNG
jgi:hypothetical protein